MPKPKHDHPAPARSSRTIRASLQRIVDRLTGRRADLAKSRRRHKAWREHAEELDRKALRRKNHGHAALAVALERRAKRAHVKAIYWKGRVRREHDAVNKLEGIEARLDKELGEWIKKHGVVVEGPNRIRGGTYEQRSKTAQGLAMRNYRNHDQPGYYSMEGGPRDYAHGLFHYASGRVWDCSTYRDALCHATGDPSPSGPRGFIDGGYTATELEHGKIISEHEARIGDAIVYLRYRGDTVGHHTEPIYDAERKMTSGHGDEAINIGCHGSYDLFGDSLYVVVRAPRHEHDLPA